jgi:hypothetical protein
MKTIKIISLILIFSFLIGSEAYVYYNNLHESLNKQRNVSVISSATYFDFESLIDEYQSMTKSLIEQEQHYDPYLIHESNRLLLNNNGVLLEVANYDRPQGQLEWKYAVVYSNEIGNGWRLPNDDELQVIYSNLYLKNQGNFNKRYSHFRYWSSEEDMADILEAHFFDFDSGVIDNTTNYDDLSKKDLMSVRLVRNVGK